MNYFIRNRSMPKETNNKNGITKAGSLGSIAFTGFLLVCGSLNAAETIVPEGFKQSNNGEIVVDDPLIAVPPDGYRITSSGVLEKESGLIAQTESSESMSVAVDSAEKNDNAAPVVEDVSEEVIAEPGTVSSDVAAVTAPVSQDDSKLEEEMEIPPGFHRMPNGDIMANNPSKAVAPPGFRLTEQGILKRQDDTSPDRVASGLATVDDFEEIPPGYHRMPDGTLMANSPSKAVAPEGYHLMPDGTLMKDGGTIDHSMHSHGHGGMWMAEYKSERMYMDGLLDTTNKVSPSDIVQIGGDYGYSMSPTDMTMDMHMLMLMYHSRNYMVMVMAHYMQNSMGMLAVDGTESTMRTSGVADTVVTFDAPWKYNIGYTVGLSIPTGSIDEHGPMQHSATDDRDTKYPYGMQLGSGTWDLILGLDYERSRGKLAWGANWDYVLRTGTNDNDYTLGDKSVLEGWTRWTFNSTTTAMANLTLREVGRIDGADPELDPTMSPSADADNYGGRRIDLAMSAKYENSKMTSVEAEFILPVQQNLFGPQMKTEWIFGLSVGYMF